jgi:Cd2+/Zn2+-exporting ATPase
MNEYQECHMSEEKKTYKCSVTGIDCAACAAKIEHAIADIDGVSDASVSFMNSSLTYACDPEKEAEIRQEIEKKVHDEEPDAVVKTASLKQYDFLIEDIDCADCAAKVERKIAAIDGIEDVSLDFMNSHLKYRCDPARSAELEAEMRAEVKKEEPDAVVSAWTEKKKVRAEEEEEEEEKNVLPRIIIGGILFVISLFLDNQIGFVLAGIAYVVLGYDVIIRAFKGIGHGQLFDEHFLMTVATFAAIYLKDMKEACGVMLFYQIGEYFQDMAVSRSRKSIGELMDIRPDSARVRRNEQWETVSPEEVAVDEIIMVQPGERIPLDGTVVSGTSSLDTASLTGEARPRDVQPGDTVISGAINQTGVLEIRTSRLAGDSTAARILSLVEDSESHKAKAENFITKFSRYYTPIVVFAAIITAIVVGVVTGDYHEGVYRACTFLVISCPCALVISIPLSFFSGIGGLSSRGVLVKGADLVENLSQVKQVVMDKTGTLTTGHFAVADVSGDREQVLKDAAYAESRSHHPLAEGIREAYQGTVDEEKIHDVQEIPGRGVSIVYEDRQVLAGNSRLMEDHGISVEEDPTGTTVYVAVNGTFEGKIVLRDAFKDDAAEAIASLKKAGKRTVLLSGDNKKITDEAAAQLGVDEAYGGCLPQDKVAKVKELKQNGMTAFVGDGVNDAPVLTAADIGIAMGALGSDAAIEAADVVIMDDDPAKISLAINAAGRILRIARENIWFAIIIKIITLVLGALGIANMWMAIFADTGVAMLCALNSLRLLRIARKK